MECQMRLPEICNHNRETVVWMHANSNCHDVYDRRRGPSNFPGSTVTWSDVQISFHEAHQRSLVLLIERGIIVIHRGKALVTA
jgi:hypothetical protein